MPKVRDRLEWQNGGLSLPISLAVDSTAKQDRRARGREMQVVLSPRLWDRFVWPYMKELVEIVAEEGGAPVLHYDANRDREIDRLKDLPARRCVLELDGKTDIFRAKKILAGHMCLLGDVHPAMLTLGTVADVEAYCNRLFDEVGPDGFIMAMGCAIPSDAKFENVKAMVDSVQR